MDASQRTSQGTSPRDDGWSGRGRILRPVFVAGMLMLPACLMIDLGVWSPFFGDDDGDDGLPTALSACCSAEARRGADFDECVDDALDGYGVCAARDADAGPAGAASP